MSGWMLFVVGGGLYVALEYFWRGRSHPTMFLAGGTALWLLGGLTARFIEWSPLALGAAGAVVVTAIEYVTGAIVNVRLGWNVWDYSDLPLNVYGQICLRYSALWFLLCVPAAAVLGVVNAI